ncbi:hypothetical protein PW5551_02890 [Petrotoga sp. 9PW.55.5.1]|uniref:ABC transporter substrate-binding protein n=1 Tax=Petrotoga sp. 9PW.55.5.1 TaxID=1308979 RepID=UPI000DC25620|nr:extracellular solute-binding protein [Petrotoga sp. 9PW.55.5.1]RAO99594.1 hypothetical protein PW5551_02890 [Petrotoga sp. 9PW.55.5.1]
MRTKLRTVLIVLIVLSVFNTFSFGAGKNDISGSIVYAVRSWDFETEQAFVKEFNKEYPNIEVQIVIFDGDLNEYLSAQASARTLPDVVYGWENLTYPISQGWIYPLDEFLEKDEEFKYVDPKLMERYKFNGKTYALPSNLQFSAVMVNLDLIEQLNMDPPSYEWTIDEFREYLINATTNLYSGINHLWGFDEVMTGMFSKNLHQLAYDPIDRKFSFTEGSWVRAINFQKNLKSVPGLVSDDLKNDAIRNAGGLDDYQKKFGKDADALREGKVLMGFHGTWDLSWIRTMNYMFDMYPLPQDPNVGYREALHADHAFMISTTKYPEAAFEFLKWRSYGKDGVLTRLNILKNKTDAAGNFTPDFIIPSTSEPEVVAMFKSLDFVPDGVKYMYDNVDKAFWADFYKIVPDWSRALNEVIIPRSEEIRQGKVEAAAIAAELEARANEIIQNAWKTFDSQLIEVQKNFKPSK